jgi:hypothetical protein
MGASWKCPMGFKLQLLQQLCLLKQLLFDIHTTSVFDVDVGFVKSSSSDSESNDSQWCEKGSWNAEREVGKLMCEAILGPLQMMHIVLLGFVA